MRSPSVISEAICPGRGLMRCQETNSTDGQICWPHNKKDMGFWLGGVGKGIGEVEVSPALPCTKAEAIPNSRGSAHTQFISWNFFFFFFFTISHLCLQTSGWMDKGIHALVFMLHVKIWGSIKKGKWSSLCSSTFHFYPLFGCKKKNKNKKDSPIYFLWF